MANNPTPPKGSGTVSTNKGGNTGTSKPPRPNPTKQG